MEEDRRVLKRKLNEANEKLKSLGDREKLYSEVLGDQMNAPVPEKLLKKIKVRKHIDLGVFRNVCMYQGNKCINCV